MTKRRNQFMSEKHVFVNILVALSAFACGWFAHQELRPFLSSEVGSASPKIATPGQLASQSRVIFNAPKNGNHASQAIRVDQVTMLQELPDSVLIEVHYHYSGSAPAGEVKLFIGMDSPYLYLASDTVHTGDGVLRLSLGLNDSKMKEEKIQQFKTNRMSISFEHYPPGAYKGVLAKELIPYTKEWSLP
jgi:hypothetical protein